MPSDDDPGPSIRQIKGGLSHSGDKGKLTGAWSILAMEHLHCAAGLAGSENGTNVAIHSFSFSLTATKWDKSVLHHVIPVTHPYIAALKRVKEVHNDCIMRALFTTRLTRAALGS